MSFSMKWDWLGSQPCRTCGWLEIEIVQCSQPWNHMFGPNMATPLTESIFTLFTSSSFGMAITHSPRERIPLQLVVHMSP